MNPSGTDDPASVEEAVALTSSDGREQASGYGVGSIGSISPLKDSSLSMTTRPGAGIQKSRISRKGKPSASLYLLAFEALSEKRGVAAGYYHIRKEVRAICSCDEQARCLVASRTKMTPDVAIA